MAQWEREEIATRISASIPIRARMGRRLGAEASLGYRYENDQMVVDPETAPVRRLIYELFYEHRRIKTVVRILNERGFRTRRGGAFTHTTVERLIRYPTAKGLRRANYTRKGASGRMEMKPEEEWIYVPVEPVVSEELWERCNLLLAEQERREKKTACRPVHLFSGLVVCADGTKMYPLSNSPKYTCKTCRRQIHPDDLEKAFVSQIKSFVFSPEQVGTHLEQADETLARRTELLSNVERERNKLLAETEKLYRLYVEERITPETFERRHRPLEKRL